MPESIFTHDVRFEPWWWEAAPRPAICESPLPQRVDVAVVGAGYTGLSAALTLARAGREVLVHEAGVAGEGASTRNGGMIGSGHRVGFSELAGRFGRDAAVAVILEGLAALDYTADLVARESIDCHFVRTGRFRGAWRLQDYEAIGREIDLLRREVGLEVDMVPRTEQHREIATDAYQGGCVYPRHGGLHPGLFYNGLLDRTLAAGAAVAPHNPVTTIARTGREFELVSRRGRLRARDVIVATNGYTGVATPAFLRRLVPVSSYVIATEPLGENMVRRLIPGRRMIVETRSAHCYYRPSPDGERLLFGGRAALAAIDPRLSARRLHGLMVGLFPELADVKVTHSWTGFVAMTRDQLPHVGAHEGIHFALGYNGSGVAMAPYLGYKVAQKVLGAAEGRTAFDHASFTPVPFYGGRPWFLPVMDAYYRVRDRLEGSP